MKKLTEPEAWREIARRIAEDEWAYNGLCYEINQLWVWQDDEASLITLDMVNAMHRRVWRHKQLTEETTVMQNADGDYAFPRGEADVRVLAALFLALEAEEEAR